MVDKPAYRILSADRRTDMKTIAYYRITPVYQEDLDATSVRQAALGCDILLGGVVDSMCGGGSDYLAIGTYEMLKSKSFQKHARGFVAKRPSEEPQE